MARLFVRVPAVDAASATPADRDRVVDGVRAFALIVVVAGHGLMGVVAWSADGPHLGNILSALPALKGITWVLQVMPLLFFAGGAANAISWDRRGVKNDTYAQWLWARAARLLRPAWLYLAACALIAAIVSLFTTAAYSDALLSVITQLLWFLGVYLVVTALTPLFTILSPLRATSLVIGLVLLSGLVDVARFHWGWPMAIGIVNFVIVWCVPTYLGALRSRGILRQVPAVALVIVAVVALGTCALLIRLGPWPLSLIGLPDEPIGNMAPPTVILALHSVVWVCVITLFNGPLIALMHRAAVWQRVVGINLCAMTLYLWHLPVLVAVTVVLHLVHLDRPVTLRADDLPIPDGWAFWFGTLGFLAVFAVGVWAVVRLMWPFEHAPLPWWDSPPRSVAPHGTLASVLALVGTVGVGICTLVISGTGLAGFPTRVVQFAGIPLNAAVAIVLLVASGALIRYAGSPRSRRGGGQVRGGLESSEPS